MCKHLALNIFYSFHDITGNSVYLIFMYLQSGQCNSCDYLTTMEIGTEMHVRRALNSNLSTAYPQDLTF